MNEKHIRSHLKILLLDDDRDKLKQLKRVLKTLEYDYDNVLEETDCEEALKHFEKFCTVKLIIIDWEMENDAAKTFVQNLLKINGTEQIKIIMATGASKQDVILGAIKMGVHHCISKPILAGALEQVIVWLMNDELEKIKKTTAEEIEKIENDENDLEQSNQRKKKIYENAVHRIKEATNFYPWKPTPYFEIGLIYDKLGLYNSAVTNYHQALFFDNKSQDACIALAKTLKILKQWNEIIKSLSPFVVRKPTSTVLELLGEAYLMTGETNKAIKSFSDSIMYGKYGKEKRSPREMAEKEMLVGKAYEQKSEETNNKEWDQKAIKSYEESKKFDPVYISAHMNLYSLYKKSGQHEKAAELLKETISITPQLSEDWLALGKIYLEQGDQPKAAFALKKAIEKSECPHHTYYEVGEAFLETGNEEDIDKAIKFMDRSISLCGEQPHVLNKLGMTYRRKGMAKEALHAYLMAVSQTPDDTNLHFNLAVAYLKSDEEKAKQLAVEHLEEAIKLKSDFPEAKQLLQKIKE
ncbi:MAG: response regulator [Nitrospinae bacterium]|nr:response regulator [Nitrospinota bacterium]